MPSRISVYCEPQRVRIILTSAVLSDTPGLLHYRRYCWEKLGLSKGTVTMESMESMESVKPLPPAPSQSVRLWAARLMES